MNKYDGIDEEVVLNVRKMAHRLKGIICLDKDDIEQELMCEIVASESTFDRSKGSMTQFVNGILHNASVDLIRAQSRDKRIGHLVPYVDQIHYTENALSKLKSNELIKRLPNKYRLLYQLLSISTIAEIARITGFSRTSVTREIRKLANCLFRHNNFENNKCVYLRRKFRMKNLSIIETSTTKDLSELPTHDLADLNEQVVKLVSHAKELREKLDDALNLRFAETVKNNLRNENKDTGTTKFVDSGFQVVAEVPKKVTWNVEQMEQIIKNMPEDKRKAIVKTSYVIDERKYANLPPEYQQMFIPARTVTPGKTRFQILVPEEQ